MHKYFSPNLPKTLKEILDALNFPYKIMSENSEKKILDKKVLKINSLKDSERGDMAFFFDPKYLEDYRNSKASFIVVPNNPELKHIEKPDDIALIQLQEGNPMAAYVLLLHYLYPDRDYYNLIGKRNMEEKYADCIVSETATIGEGAVLSPQCFIGRGVKIGKNCFIGPNVSITHSEIGDNCVIHSGARIGIDGFGCFRQNGKMVKIKQIGRVIIGNNVEIGANCTIDRGAIGGTIIGDYCSLDNQIHVAHNVVLGERVIIAAQAGIAGSTVIGNDVSIGGQCGIAGHIKIDDRVMIAAKSGVAKSVSPDKIIAGSPATDINVWRKSCAILKRLAKK